MVNYNKIIAKYMIICLLQYNYGLYNNYKLDVEMT